MAFLPELNMTYNKSTVERPTEFDRECNLRLKKLAASQGWFVSHSVKNGAVRFRILRASLVRAGAEPAAANKRIKKLLDWYVKNAPLNKSDPKFPKLPTGKRFCDPDMLDWVERLVKREEKDKPRTASKRADRIARNIAQTMHWPKGSKTQLPWIVDQSLKNLDTYVKALRRVNLKKIKAGISREKISRQIKSGQADMDPKLRKRLTHEQLVDMAVKGFKETHVRRLQGLRSVIESMFSGGDESFVERWLTSVNKQVRDWKEWSGSLDYYVFSPSHKVWDRMVRERVQEWGGVGAVNLWEKFKGGLDAQV